MSRLLALATLGALWAPFALLVLNSFDPVVLQHGATRSSISAYALLMADGQLRASLGLSVIVATLVAIASTVLAAFIVSLARSEQARHASRFRPMAVYGLVVGLGLGMPEVVLGLSASMLLAIFGVEAAVLRLAGAHLFLGVSVALGIVLRGSTGIPLAFELAARDCGAGLAAAAVRVTLPLHCPLLAAGFVAAWLVSFEDLAIAFFASPAGEMTLPQYVFSLFRFRRLPEAHALGTIMVAAAIVLSLGLGPLVRRAIPRGDDR